MSSGDVEAMTAQASSGHGDPPPPKHARISLAQHTIHKRPLLHPAIASPHRRGSARAPKVVYISSRTPFLASVKRVRKLLDGIEKRRAPPVPSGAGTREILAAVEEGARRRRGGGGAVGRGAQGRGRTSIQHSGRDEEGEEEEEVVIKGTGKAIEKVLALGMWWMGKEGVQVQTRTQSVGAVDDIVKVDGAEDGEGGGDRAAEADDMDVDPVAGAGDEVPSSYSRVRMVSCLEVAIKLV